MKPLTCASWLALLRGPYSTSSSSGWPVLVSAAAFARAATKSSWIDSWTRTRVAAVQSWPALKKPATEMSSTALSMSTSSKTTTGALPPSSRWTRLTSLAADSATCMPARTEPVMAARAGVECSTMARPVSRSPQTTLKTPLGRIAPMISAISTVDAGVVSDGLSTTVLPAAMAGANFHTAIIIG